MKPLLHAIAFLTRIPVPVPPDSRAWVRSTAYYPVVGLIIGLAVGVFDWAVAAHFPPPVRAVLVTAGWVAITGGLHLDGLMDTVDGLGSHREPERVLAIMQDSRVGAMGVLAALLILLLKAAALASPVSSLFLSVTAAAVTGRSAVLIAIAGWPYRREGGLGAGMKEGLPPLRLGGALATGGVLLLIARGWDGLLLLTAGGAFAWLAGRYVTRRIGGLTGDVYGALIEGVETVTLLLILLLEGR